MTNPINAGPPCPSCGGDPLSRATGAGIRGGVPTSEEIETTRYAHADRMQGRRAGGGPVTCSACGDTLYRCGPSLLPHRSAPPVLPMAIVADRLRNHLRRLGIVRLGRIEGDAYLLPYLRFEGETPDGETTFLQLGVSLGEERIESPFLPPADLKRFAPLPPGSAGSSGPGFAVLRVLPPSLDETVLRARAESGGCRVTRPIEWIHYPMWLMRVEDCGKAEGAWMDGIEGKFIRHRMRLTPPFPSLHAAATIAAGSASAAMAVGIALAAPAAGAAAGAGIWLLAAPALHGALLRSWRG